MLLFLFNRLKFSIKLGWRFPMSVKIRPARVEEADKLTDLVLRSKAYWGYNDEFMQAAAEHMAITPKFLAESRSFVLELDGKMIGLSSLVDQGEVIVLDNLFIAPDHIGQGWGQRLWDHALDFARRGGYKVLQLDADPYAVGFYQKQGAEVVGETASTLKEGRTLPVMRLELD